jgi:hypothetical protein
MKASDAPLYREITINTAPTFGLGDAPDFVEPGEAGAVDDVMRCRRRLQLVGYRSWPCRQRYNALIEHRFVAVESLLGAIVCPPSHPLRLRREARTAFDPPPAKAGLEDIELAGQPGSSGKISASTQHPARDDDVRPDWGPARQQAGTLRTALHWQ